MELGRVGEEGFGVEMIKIYCRNSQTTKKETQKISYGIDSWLEDRMHKIHILNTYYQVSIV